MSIPTVLVLPFPAQGHVNPIMSFAQKLVEHGCNIIFVNTEFIHMRVVNSMVKEESSIDGSPIKLVSIPDCLESENERSDPGELCVSVLTKMPSMLEKLIENIHLNSENRISCIVVDGIMAWGLEVACKLGIKGAVFWPASVGILALQYNTPMLIDDGIIDSDGFPITKKSFQISPTLPPMDPSMLWWWSNISDAISVKKIFHYLLHCTRALNLTEWWVGNSTYELEPVALSFIPKLQPIGPLLKSATVRSLGQFWEEDLSCMSWLDQQPHNSVLYVAFGSLTLFDQTQFKELALGLQLTNRPFLWVVREDPNCSNKMAYPNEFLGSQGKIVGWAPQQKVLSHTAIACFISHCGWNSTMEGLSNGVPFLCWPYFADQFYNKIYICDVLKVDLGFDSEENEVVSCEEIKKRVDQLLSDDNIRSRSLNVKEKLLKNLVEGGQSSNNLIKFVKWLQDRKNNVLMSISIGLINSLILYSVHPIRL